MSNFIRTITLCAFGLLLISSKSFAASIQIEDGQTCEVSLSGQIVPGDLDRLRSAVEEVISNTPDREREGGRPFKLCLNSPGGSFGEAARIARFTRDWGLATRIQANTACLSVCSWIFMLGTTDQMWGSNSGEYLFTDRRLDATARLGFHAPLLDLGDRETVRTSIAQKGYEALVAAFAEILTMSYSDGASLIHPDLVEHAMRTPPRQDTFFFIDTVDKAGRWGIGVDGISFPNLLSSEAAINACLNATAWNTSLSASVYGYDGWESAVEGSSANLISGQNSYEIIGALSGYHSHTCSVNASLDITPVDQARSEYSIRVSGCFVYTGDALDSCGGVDAIAVFPPDTRLEFLGSNAGRGHARNLTRSTPLPRSSHSCVMETTHARVINVNEFVNIRRNASLNAPIVARASLGELLALPKPDNWFFLETQRGRQCSSLCEQAAGNASNRYLQDQVRTCIEGAEIWQLVRNSRGQEGYVSVYFLVGEQ